MDDPSNGVFGNLEDSLEYDGFATDDLRWAKPNRTKNGGKSEKPRKVRSRDAGNSKGLRVESRDGTFRCRHCKTIVGVPISGGKHRNHCPLCLYSRHVDASRPGDRSSTCRSMMWAIGTFARRSGEQVLVHECLGCGIVRNNRVAADDNTVATMRLPVLPAGGAGVPVEREEKSAS